MEEFEGTDATVTNKDGLIWVEELMAEPIDTLAARLANIEPAVAATAAMLMQRTHALLCSYGVPESVAERAAKKVLRSGVMCAELMRRGHAKLWDDLIQPASDEPGSGENHHE